MAFKRVARRGEVPAGADEALARIAHEVIEAQLVDSSSPNP
jgi:hypothetical protein